MCIIYYLLIIIIYKVPENNAIIGFCEGLVRAWELYNNTE